MAAAGRAIATRLDRRVVASEARVADPEQTLRDFIARQKIGRLGTPEEIAEIATYLASDPAAYATGQTFVVDGGEVFA